MSSREGANSSASDSALDEVWERFICPMCQASVSKQVDGLICPAGHQVSLIDGYLDASSTVTDPSTRETLEAFGYEWTTFDKIQPEDGPFFERYFSDVKIEELKDKVGLDAGCGKGRFSFFASPFLGSIVALDGSAAVAAAARNLERFDNCAVVKADLDHIPFKSEAFDIIWCLGVLHHLGDPEAGFEQLVAKLAPQGQLLIYVYSRPTTRGVRSVALSAARLLRRLTVKLPHPLLRWLCAPLGGLLYVSVVVPGRLGDAVSIGQLSRLPLQTYRGRPLRSLWLDTFDRLSAPIERRYVWEEIELWFQRAGLKVDAVREDAGLIVLAHRP